MPHDAQSMVDPPRRFRGSRGLDLHPALCGGTVMPRRASHSASKFLTPDGGSSGAWGRPGSKKAATPDCRGASSSVQAISAFLEGAVA